MLLPTKPQIARRFDDKKAVQMDSFFCANDMTGSILTSLDVGDPLF